MSSHSFDSRNESRKQLSLTSDEEPADHTPLEPLTNIKTNTYDPNITRITFENSASADSTAKSSLDTIQPKSTQALRFFGTHRKGSAGRESPASALRVHTGDVVYSRDLPLRQSSRDSPASTRSRADTASSNEVERTLSGAGLFRAKTSEPQSPRLPSAQTDQVPASPRELTTGPSTILTSHDIIRPSTAREHAISDGAELPPTPRLRTSDTVPEHRFLRYAHPESSRVGPRSKDIRFHNSPAPPSSFMRHPVIQNSPKTTITKDPNESVRSADTNISSPVDVSSTERSSISTSMTSASELLTPNTPWSIKPKDEDFSVEDYIALYAEGFEDDPSTVNVLQAPSKSAQAFTAPYPSRTTSIPPLPKVEESIVEAPSVPKPFAEPSLGRVTSAQMFEGKLVADTVLAEPEQQVPEPDPNADRYGFKKNNHHISVDQYDSWNTDYQQYLDRRRQKWNDLMRQHRLSVGQPAEFPPKSDKIKRFVRKGIPPEWRGAAWFWYAGGPTRLAQNKGLYDHLIRRTAEKGQLGEGDREHIERDLNRTFPDNDQFKRLTASSTMHSRQASVVASIASIDSEQIPQERPMIQSLRRVLQAFAVHQPKIGYCQSLNFLAGQLLLFLYGDEEKAFHLLCILTSEHLPGTHGIVLEGANVDIGVLMQTLKASMPALWAKLDDRATDNMPPTPTIGKDDMRRTRALPTVSLATTSWFMSCFVGTLPVETCCRVWDVLFYEGSKTLFRIALGIFRLGESEIRNIRDPSEIFQVVQTLPRKMLDANALMEASLGKDLEGRGLLSSNTVRKRREERREMYSRERSTSLRTATAAGSGESTASPTASEGVQQDDPEAKRPLSRGMSMKSLSRFKSMRRKKPPPLPAPQAS